MVVRKQEGSLTKDEQRIIKALLAQGLRNQDIQALVNIGRSATINGARVTEVKKNPEIKPAADEAVSFYKLTKKAYDPHTGLNRYEDERLIRAREAMILAVQIFNSGALNFKTEVFAILANIAWTYLLHEFYWRKKVGLINKDGNALLLSQMLKRDDCPLTAGTKRNLHALKIIRDEVEHTLMGNSDAKWLSLYQACCLNFDRVICELFGSELSLQRELSFALQFAKLSMEQISEIQKHGIPGSIEALDERLSEGLSTSEMDDLDYRFRVVYTLDSSAKGQAHLNFVHPGSEEAKEIKNVLMKYTATDDLYPHKAGGVVKTVQNAAGKTFSSHNHTQAWRLYKVRPKNGSDQPKNTNKDFCIYHAAHGDYTYSQKWVDFLVAKISTDEGFNAIKAIRI